MKAAANAARTHYGFLNFAIAVNQTGFGAGEQVEKIQ